MLVVTRSGGPCWKTTTCCPGDAATLSFGVVPSLRPSIDTIDAGVEFRSTRQSTGAGARLMASATGTAGAAIGCATEPGAAGVIVAAARDALGPAEAAGRPHRLQIMSPWISPVPRHVHRRRGDTTLS